MSQTQSPIPADVSVFDNTADRTLGLANAAMLQRALFDFSTTPGYVFMQAYAAYAVSFQIVESNSQCGPGRYSIRTLSFALAVESTAISVAMAVDFNLTLWRISASSLSADGVAFVALVKAYVSIVPSYVSILLPSSFALDSSTDVPETTYIIAVEPSVDLRWHYVMAPDGSTVTPDAPVGIYGVAISASWAAPFSLGDADFAASRGEWSNIGSYPGVRLGAQKLSCAASSTSSQSQHASRTESSTQARILIQSESPSLRPLVHITNTQMSVNPEASLSSTYTSPASASVSSSASTSSSQSASPSASETRTPSRARARSYTPTSSPTTSMSSSIVPPGGRASVANGSGGVSGLSDGLLASVVVTTVLAVCCLAALVCFVLRRQFKRHAAPVPERRVDFLGSVAAVELARLDEETPAVVLVAEDAPPPAVARSPTPREWLMSPMREQIIRPHASSAASYVDTDAVHGADRASGDSCDEKPTTDEAEDEVNRLLAMRADVLLRQQVQPAQPAHRLASSALVARDSDSADRRCAVSASPQKPELRSAATRTCNLPHPLATAPSAAPHNATHRSFEPDAEEQGRPLVAVTNVVVAAEADMALADAAIAAAEASRSALRAARVLRRQRAVRLWTGLSDVAAHAYIEGRWDPFDRAGSGSRGSFVDSPAAEGWVSADTRRVDHICARVESSVLQPSSSSPQAVILPTWRPFFKAAKGAVRSPPGLEKRLQRLRAALLKSGPKPDNAPADASIQRSRRGDSVDYAPDFEPEASEVDMQPSHVFRIQSPALYGVSRLPLSVAQLPLSVRSPARLPRLRLARTHTFHMLQPQTSSLRDSSAAETSQAPPPPAGRMINVVRRPKPAQRSASSSALLLPKSPLRSPERLSELHRHPHPSSGGLASADAATSSFAEPTIDPRGHYPFQILRASDNRVWQPGALDWLLDDVDGVAETSGQSDSGGQLSTNVSRYDSGTYTQDRKHQYASQIGDRIDGFVRGKHGDFDAARACHDGLNNTSPPISLAARSLPKRNVSGGYSLGPVSALHVTSSSLRGRAAYGTGLLDATVGVEGSTPRLVVTGAVAKTYRGSVSPSLASGVLGGIVRSPLASPAAAVEDPGDSRTSTRREFSHATGSVTSSSIHRAASRLVAAAPVPGRATLRRSPHLDLTQGDDVQAGCHSESIAPPVDDRTVVGTSPDEYSRGQLPQAARPSTHLRNPRENVGFFRAAGSPIRNAADMYDEIDEVLELLN